MFGRGQFRTEGHYLYKLGKGSHMMLKHTYLSSRPCEFSKEDFQNFQIKNLFLALTTQICNGLQPYEQLS